MKRWIFSAGLVIALLATLFISVSIADLSVTLKNNFDLILLGIFAIIYTVLAFNEVTIIENGYEKRYRFTSFILIVSLLISEKNVTLLSALIGTLIYVTFIIIKEKVFDIKEILFRFTSPMISVAIMCLVFEHSGGKQFDSIDFPRKFILVIAISFINYFINTIITIINNCLKENVPLINIYRILMREYGWIYKYDFWQAIYAILFFNSAAVFLYGNSTLR